jgi:hypothetical protein
MEEYITMEHLFFTETTPSFVAADAKRFVAAVKSNPETLGKIGDGIVTLWHQMHSKAQDRNHVMTRTIYRLMCYANQTLSPWEHNQEDENGS